ncbi:MAG: hypothetical protein KME22_09350 [Hassallia sp. WJT32-NPBG1]|jgi:hypothetical protein|nr:hypothetical protein [Hassallia sp. WJT32-NPBG1]
MINITEAMHYANIQEKMALLGITDESVAQKAQEIGIVTAEEQKKAEEALWQKSIIDHEEKMAQARITPFPAEDYLKKRKIYYAGSTEVIYR